MNSRDYLEDIITLPSLVTDSNWIFIHKYHARALFDHLKNDEVYRWFDVENPPKGTTGKWMVFFEKNDYNHDIAWETITYGYIKGELPGVSSIKTSTAKDNSRADSKDTGVVILYCDDSENADHIYEVGNTIIKFIRKHKLHPALSWSGHIHYKTDDQTELGTRATGQTCNHTYRLLFNNLFEE